MRRLVQQLRWLIAIRLVAITSIAVPYLLLQLTGRGIYQFDFLYRLAGFTYLASLVYIGFLQSPLRRHPQVLAYLQFVGDLLLITALVYHFGGIPSPFSILYLVIVILASTLLRQRAGLIVSALAWTMYASTVVAIHQGWVAAPDLGARPEAVTGTRVAYSLGMHLFGFFAVALLTSRLAQQATRTERELEERTEDLADLQHFHRDVIRSVPSGLVTTDGEARVTSLNRAGEEILGVAEGDLLGRRIYETGLVTVDQWLAFGSPDHDPRRRHEAEWRRDGEARWIGYSVTQLTKGDGTPTGRIVIFQDLTEVRRLQEEIRIKDRMAAVGEMASGLAHEIGNPLAAISGSVQMLSSDVAADTPQRKLLQIIFKESQRLDATIKSFLDFARPRQASSVRFDVAALLAENVELLRHSSEVLSGHRLELDLRPRSAHITGDCNQISQIFWNLARNALRAMPGGGLLKVVGRLDRPTYSFQVIDTGRGMTAEEKANLFHPFRSFFDGGTGIGMAIVYRIVEEHGGRLRVDSAPDQGTTISVELPVEAAPPRRRPVEAGSR